MKDETLTVHRQVYQNISLVSDTTGRVQSRYVVDDETRDGKIEKTSTGVGVNGGREQPMVSTDPEVTPTWLFANLPRAAVCEADAGLFAQTRPTSPIRKHYPYQRGIYKLCLANCSRVSAADTNRSYFLWPCRPDGLSPRAGVK